MVVVGGVVGGVGGGGGGPAPKIQFLDENQMRTQQRVSLSNGEKMTFRLSNQNNHSLTINEILEESVNLTIASEPVNLMLFVGEEVKLNLTDSEYYDLYIKLESIEQNNANITIKEIKEAIFVQPEEPEEESRDYPWMIISLIVIIFVIISVYFLRKNKNKNDEKSKKKQVRKNKKKNK